MHKVVVVFVLYSLVNILISSCGAGQLFNPTVAPSATNTDTPSIILTFTSTATTAAMTTSTPTFTPKSKAKRLFTPTPIPTTAQRPTPTLFQTITPTFDAYHIATATRSPAEICPEKNPAIRPPDFGDKIGIFPVWPPHFQQPYLDYLNAGGTLDALSWRWRPDYVMDLTNDGVPEIIIEVGSFLILGCQSGQYRILLDSRVAGDGSNYIEAIRDANQNGVPEFILREKLTQSIVTFDYLEWDGVQFRSLFVPNDRNISENGLFEMQKGRAQFGYKASETDPLIELAVSINPPYWDDNYLEGFPWRNEIDYYKWNGSKFVFIIQDYASPTFRFQAIHDGDWAFLYGEYNKAISYYQQAIHDDNLLWFTEGRRKFLLVKDMPWKFRKVTPTYPTYDPNEYPNLAAYGYFRMILAEIKLGRISSSQTTYDWLQTNFPSDKPGHVYAELASAFWSEYQKSQSLSQGCFMTYEFTNTHLEEIFRYITNSVIIDGKRIEWPNPVHFGQQSSELNYSPEMICPSK